MGFSPFCYKAWVRKLDWKTGQLISTDAIHDGDSGWFYMDKGNREFLNANCRLYGCNANELSDTDPVKRQQAVDARTWLRAQIEGKEVFVYSKSLDKYGRPLVIIWLNEADFGDNTKSVNKALINAGLAVPYMGELM